MNIDYFRGSEDDVLDRYYNASKKFNADIVVRLCSDSPLLDGKIVDNNGLRDYKRDSTGKLITVLMFTSLFFCFT